MTRRLPYLMSDRAWSLRLMRKRTADLPSESVTKLRVLLCSHLDFERFKEGVRFRLAQQAYWISRRSQSPPGATLWFPQRAASGTGWSIGYFVFNVLSIRRLS